VKDFRRLLQYAGLVRRVFYKGRSLPIYLICFITARCPAKCKHCFNWHRQTDGSADTELTIDEYEKISRSMGDLAFVFLTGGEPHLRDDFPEIARIFHKNNRAIRIQSPTNGFDPDRILRHVEEILQTCPELQFGQGVSLDGIGDEHDKQRDLPGLFDRAVETIKGLRKLADRYPNFALCSPITISAFNQDTIVELYHFMRDKLGAGNFFVNYVRGTPRDPGASDLSIERYCEISDQIDADLESAHTLGYQHVLGHQWFNAKNLITRDVVKKTVLENRRVIPCYAGQLAGVIYENGEVNACELINEPLGNLRENDYDMKRVWHSEKADAVRTRIRREKCRCTHECFMSTNILFNPWLLTRCTAMVAKSAICKLLSRSAQKDG